MLTFPGWLVTVGLRVRGKRVFRTEANLVAEVQERALTPTRHRPPRLLEPLVRIRATTRRGWRCYELSSRSHQGQGAPVVYFHGGAYTFEIGFFQWVAAARIAILASVPVVVPIYPLAPHSTAATTVPTAAAVVAAVVADVVADVVSEAGEGGVSIMGDSAGGGLALAVAQQFGRSASTALWRLILIAPWLDITLDEAARDADVPRDAMLDRPGLREAGRLYRGELSETDPRVSPLNGDLSQLPPIGLFTGTYDLVHCDAVRLRRRAREAGVSVDYYELACGQHVYPLLPDADGAAALRQIARLVS